MNDPYLATSRLLDYRHPRLQQLIQDRQWLQLSDFRKIGAVYEFVRDEIPFGYNADDDLPASRVLQDGYGQCNTKGTLLMALLRAVGIPNRFHGFSIHNALQKGAVPEWLFPLAPARILHSWVEVLYEGEWLELEGFIIDQAYLQQVQKAFAPAAGPFSGYGIATPCLAEPPIHWNGSHTYIQKEGIAEDFGVYETPDQFYAEAGTNLRGIRRLVYRYLGRHLMNRNVRRIRARGL